MHGIQKRGLDYTPLFKFLISKVGQNWNEIFSEAKSRLDRIDPIYWLVAITDSEKKEIIRLGESSYYTGLFVDSNGILQFVNSKINPSDLKKSCICCTHTLNGIPFEELI